MDTREVDKRDRTCKVNSQSKLFTDDGYVVERRWLDKNRISLVRGSWSVVWNCVVLCGKTSRLFSTREGCSGSERHVRFTVGTIHQLR